MTEEKVAETREVPIVEEDFAALLRKYKVKPEQAANIAEHISHTGGPTAFEDPQILTARLSAWSGEIAPAKRKLALEQWFAEKGIDVPAELIEKAGMTTEQTKKAEKEEAEKTVRYVYDPEQRVVRMAKREEPGGTMAQATQLKKMAETDEGGVKESPFIMSNDGKWVFNPKAKISGIEVMAFEMIKKSQERGEPVDPVDAMAQAAEKMKIYRDAFGGGGSTLPDWMTNPAEFISQIRNILGEGGAFGGRDSALPGWMTDPVEFISRIRTISGEGGASEVIRSELAAVRKSLEDMKEQRNRDQIEGQQQQIVALTNKLTDLAELVRDPARLPGAKSEMDILYQIATEGTALLKSELPNLRKDVREALGSVNLPPGKTSEERQDRKKRYSKALQANREIEALGKRIFFGES